MKAPFDRQSDSYRPSLGISRRCARDWCHLKVGRALMRIGRFASCDQGRRGRRVARGSRAGVTRSPRYDRVSALGNRILDRGDFEAPRSPPGNRGVGLKLPLTVGDTCRRHWRCGAQWRYGCGHYNFAQFLAWQRDLRDLGATCMKRRSRNLRSASASTAYFTLVAHAPSTCITRFD